jgi:ADP-ribosylglycohydrolase
MYMAPVGVVNAADPDAAYAEAIDLTGAHQTSYGREAAGVMAACAAEAMRPAATVSSVLDTALRLAKDGTRSAISAVAEAASGVSSWEDAVTSGVLRDAVVPYDTVGENYRDQGLGARRPSRVHSIEELPIALGMLIIADGDWTQAVLGGVNYGRDSDSIATMSGAIAGALGGQRAVPAGFVDDIAEASRVDIVAPGARLAAATREIRVSDARRAAAIESSFRDLVAT